jgi:hypothetical protein
MVLRLPVGKCMYMADTNLLCGVGRGLVDFLIMCIFSLKKRMNQTIDLDNYRKARRIPLNSSAVLFVETLSNALVSLSLSLSF